MEEKAVQILNSYGTMAIATVRADGWPQNTTVSYANDGTLIYFVISRTSQKFANIRRDPRVSLAIGSLPADPHQLRALSLGAMASEVTDSSQREHALQLLLHRHPDLRQFGPPNFGRAAMMRAQPTIMTILDYTLGFGHADEVALGPSNVPDMQPARDDNWGFSPAPPAQDKPLVD